MKFTIKKIQRITGGEELVIQRLTNNNEIEKVRIPYTKDTIEQDLIDTIIKWWGVDDIELIYI